MRNFFSFLCYWVLILVPLHFLVAEVPKTEEPETKDSKGLVLPSWGEEGSLQGNFEVGLWPESLMRDLEISWIEFLVKENDFEFEEDKVRLMKILSSVKRVQTKPSPVKANTDSNP